MNKWVIHNTTKQKHALLQSTMNKPQIIVYKLKRIFSKFQFKVDTFLRGNRNLKDMLAKKWYEERCEKIISNHIVVCMIVLGRLICIHIQIAIRSFQYDKISWTCCIQ